MALTAADKSFLAQYFNKEYAERGPSFGLFLVDFLLLTKTQQSTLVSNYLNNRKTANTNAISGLDAQKTAAEAALTAENSLIDGILAQL